MEFTTKSRGTQRGLRPQQKWLQETRKAEKKESGTLIDANRY